MEPKKSKKLVRVILIIATILALASVGVAFYLSTINDVSPQDTNADSETGCGCYYVDTTTGVDSCASADPRDAFYFKAGTLTDGSCSVNCPLTDIPTQTDIETGNVISCDLDTSGEDLTCSNLTVKNSSDQIITNVPEPLSGLTIEAYFDQTEEETSSYYFSVNGTRIDVSPDDVTEEIGMEVAKISYPQDDDGALLRENVQALNVQAFGNSALKSDITSSACLREYKVEASTDPICTNLTAEFEALDGDEINVTEIDMEVGNIDGAETLVAQFTHPEYTGKLQTVDLLDYVVSGSVILNETFLDDETNFEESFWGDQKSFDGFETAADSFGLSAELLVDGEAIDSAACNTEQDIVRTTGDSTSDQDGTDTQDDTGTDSDVSDTDDTDTDSEPSQDDGTGTGETSNFSVSKTGSEQCLERETPNNEVEFTITITNNDTTYEDVSKIVDKLPLGFTYVDGSSVINDSAVTDSEYVTVETVGSAEQITWEASAGWSVAASDTLTVTFTALAGTNALTGENQNEVVVTPVNTPVDPDTLRTEYVLEVAQSCTAPETGLFDTTRGRIVGAMIVIMLAFGFYYTSTGDIFSEKIVSTGAYKSLRTLGLRLTDPRQYFEEKFERDNKKAKGSRKS